MRVKDVLELLAAGASHEDILADYPFLEADDIAAVLEFAARQNDHPVLRQFWDGVRFLVDPQLHPHRLAGSGRGDTSPSISSTWL